MKLYLTTFIFILLQFFSFSSLAEEKYISDTLSVYIRRGPGLQYPLSGTLTAGDKVNVLEISKDGKYARIQDAQNHISWVENAALQDNPAARTQVKQLESQLSQTQHRLNTAEHSQDDAIERIREKLVTSEENVEKLRQENEALLSDNNNHTKTIRELKAHLTKNHRNIDLNWFLYGGIVAGGGLLLGLLLPILMPRRRKYDRWID